MEEIEPQEKMITVIVLKDGKASIVMASIILDHTKHNEMVLIMGV